MQQVLAGAHARMTSARLPVLVAAMHFGVRCAASRMARGLGAKIIGTIRLVTITKRPSRFVGMTTAFGRFC